jgi:predicted cobalt transporter CbtA
VIQARIRWVPPVILCMAILIYSLLPQPQAPFDSMQDAYTTIAWAEFITGPLAVTLMASGFAGLLCCYYQYKEGMRTMVFWGLAGVWLMAARPLLSCIFTS